MDDTEKPTYYVYIILCAISILFFIAILLLLFNKTARIPETEQIDIPTDSMFGSGRKNCETTKTYCFTDNDCFQQCIATTLSCIHGVCLNNVNTSEATNECDPSKGVIGYFIGNTALGTYEYICKSVDPAIAISVSENRMCYGDSTYHIDYLSVYPSIYSCTCEDQIIVPATTQKRRHVECNSTYKDLVN